MTRIIYHASKNPAQPVTADIPLTSCVTIMGRPVVTPANCDCGHRERHWYGTEF